MPLPAAMAFTPQCSLATTHYFYHQVLPDTNCYSFTYPKGVEGWVGLSSVNVNKLLKIITRQRLYSLHYCCRNCCNVWNWVHHCIHCITAQETHCSLSFRCHTATCCLQVMSYILSNVLLPYYQVLYRVCQKLIPWEKFNISGIVVNFFTKVTCFTLEDSGHISCKFQCLSLLGLR